MSKNLSSGNNVPKVNEAVATVEKSFNILACRFKDRTITRKEFNDLDNKFAKILSKLGFRETKAMFEIRRSQWARVIIRYNIVLGFKEDKLVVTPEDIRNEKH